MKKLKRFLCTGTICFATAVGGAGVGVTIPNTAEAFDFKKAGRQFKKELNNAGKQIGKTVKKLNKNGGAEKLITGVGAGLLVGIATDSAAAGVLAGVVIAAAPEVFQKNFVTTYRGEMEWANSVNSNKKRVVVAPGRKVSDKQRAEINAKVKEDVKDIQRALTAIGLYKSGIDGDFGPGSRAGVKEFQRSLGEAETGALTAEQRHRLFLQAENGGFVRARVLDGIDKSIAVNVSAPAAVAAPVAGAAVKAIPEYRLAKLRFEKLTSGFLQAGPIAAVSKTEMLPDGTITIVSMSEAGDREISSAGKITGLAAVAHALSADWAQIVFTDNAGSAIVLNTRDDFTSPAEAGVWIEDFNKEVALLAKLTGSVSEPTETPGVIAVTAPDGDKPQVVAAAVPSPKTAQPEVKPSQTSQAPGGSAPPIAADADGTIVIAEAKPEVSAPATGNAPDQAMATGNTTDGLTGFDAVPQTCRQGVYLSFNFPGEDNPVTHYNIISPSGTLTMDNGDKTTYITGNCVQGEYVYSYVHVQKGKSEKDWKDVKREGSFMLASNSEQCSINLNTPTGSAEVMCF